MASASTIILVGLVLTIALVGGYVFLFGIPPWLKKELEEKALETMGENKQAHLETGPSVLTLTIFRASYMVQQGMGKIPDSDQQDVQDLKKGLGNAVGGGLKNPLGKFAGNTADDATRPATGR